MRQRTGGLAGVLALLLALALSPLAGPTSTPHTAPAGSGSAPGMDARHGGPAALFARHGGPAALFARHGGPAALFAPHGSAPLVGARTGGGQFSATPSAVAAATARLDAGYRRWVAAGAGAWRPVGHAQHSWWGRAPPHVRV